MRTRKKLTALGALTLAGSAIVGGALVTSHAMAAGTTPTKGTITIVSMQAGADSAIQCTYDGVDLPSPTALPDGSIGGAIAVPVGNGIVSGDAGVAVGAAAGSGGAGATTDGPHLAPAPGEAGTVTFSVGRVVGAPPADATAGDASGPTTAVAAAGGSASGADASGPTTDVAGASGPTTDVTAAGGSASASSGPTVVSGADASGVDGSGPTTDVAGASGPTVVSGSLPDLPGTPAIVLDSKDARPGTAAECAALQPATQPAP